MNIAAHHAMLAGGGAPTAKSYIQDGLVAMWDGLENDGWGVFNPNKGNNWYDLVGNKRISGFGWNNTCGWFDKSFCPLNRVSGFSANLVAVDLSHGMTVECCAPGQFRRNQIITCGVMSQWGVERAAYYGCSYNDTAYRVRKDGNESLRLTQFLNNNTKNTQTLFIHSDGNMSGLIGGSSDYAWEVSASFSQTYINPYFISTTGSTSVGAPTFYNARYYNRILTLAEVAHNYAIDKARFGLT